MNKEMKKVIESEGVERYLSEKELAATLGVTRYIIRKWRKYEGLPFITAGTRFLYRLSRVKAWLESKEQRDGAA